MFSLEVHVDRTFLFGGLLTTRDYLCFLSKTISNSRNDMRRNG